MLRRAAVGALLLLLMSSFVIAQHRPGGGGNPPPVGGGGNQPSGNAPSIPGLGGNMGNRVSLTLRVVFTNEQAVPDNVHVQLVSITGVPVGDGFTRNEGQITFPNIAPGRYTVKVSGNGVQDFTSDAIYLESGASRSFEWVHVKPAEDSSTAVGSLHGGPISAVELNAPDKAKKEFRTGNDAFAKGDFKKALEHLQKAVSIYPRYGAAYNNIGAVYVKQNDMSSAKSAFAKALEADPALSNANANLARIDLLEKKPEDAVVLLDRGLTSDPTNPEMLFLMAEAKYFTQHYDEAITYARRVHSGEHEKYATAHLVAAKSFEAQQKMPEAKAEYELFLKESPDAPQAAQVRQVVEQMNAALAKTAPVPKP